LFFIGVTQNNCMNGNFQDKRISADSDYGQQSSGKITIDLFLIESHNYCCYCKEKMNN